MVPVDSHERNLLLTRMDGAFVVGGAGRVPKMLLVLFFFLV